MFWNRIDHENQGSPLDFQRYHPLTVAQLTRSIKNILEQNLPVVWVEGEISNVALPRSGHLYFSLKDEHAQIRAVMFRNNLRTVKFTPEDGMKVVLSGTITVYEARGDYQIIVSSMEPKGIGALQLAFEQLKLKLAAEGLFEQDRKKPLPLFPQKIGIVTSSTGAAIHDILNIVNRRFSNVHILLFPAKVQGKEAAAEIVAGIQTLNQRDDIDVIIVGRGGGSIEDLWPFNEEIVARAIFTSTIPVISAVGHETDFTIADFVADLRAPTPSAAAELVVKSKTELLQRLLSLEQRIHQSMRQGLEYYFSRLQALVSRPVYTDPSRYFMKFHLYLDDVRNRFSRVLERRFANLQARVPMVVQKLVFFNPVKFIDRLEQERNGEEEKLVRAMVAVQDKYAHAVQQQMAHLQALSPLAHLKRGYSIVLNSAQDRLIKKTVELQNGQPVWLQFQDGQALCTVVQINHIMVEGLSNEKEKNDL